MNKYFLVPVTSKNVKLNGMTLKDILKEVDLELYDREEERLVLTYGHEKDPKKINEFNTQTRKLYAKKGVPEKIIVLSESDGELAELQTRNKIEAEESYLEVFSSPLKEAADILLHTSYYETIDRFVDASKVMTNEIKKKK